MTLALLAFFGGALTIFSPCILPVLPFVFAGASVSRRALPMLLGLAASFAAMAALAAWGGGWAAQANQFGRDAALILMALFGLALLFEGLAQRLAAPLVGWGARLSMRAQQGEGFGAALLLGVATGLLWAPCAGPILGLLLTGAALEGANAASFGLFLAYGLGAACALAVALRAGGALMARLKRGLGFGVALKKLAGAAVLAAALAIGLGLDQGALADFSLARGEKLESFFVDRLAPAQNPEDGAMMMMKLADSRAESAPPDEGAAPDFAGATLWLNSPPLTREQLKGKVVLVDFWTYSCINCLRSLPHVRAWAEKYRDAGLVVIGVHAPEFAFEHDPKNVRRAVADLKIDYPVALDNDFKIWRRFDNHYWPAHYFIDARGRLRGHHFGEGEYDDSEKLIRQLLNEAGGAMNSTLSAPKGDGAQKAPDFADLRSPETYIGHERAENFGSPGGINPDQAKSYAPGAARLNHWSLAGDWTVGAEMAQAEAPGAKILYRFHARDLHLVLGPGPDGKPIRFKVQIDGAAPGDDHGADISPAGDGVVDGERLYQLVRQSGEVRDRDFTIEFLDPGARAYAFTFG